MEQKFQGGPWNLVPEWRYTSLVREGLAIPELQEIAESWAKSEEAGAKNLQREWRDLLKNLPEPLPATDTSDDDELVGVPTKYLVKILGQE